MAGPTFADLLRTSGVVSEETLARSENDAARNGISVWDAIVDSGAIGEGRLADAVAEASGLPRLDLRMVRVDPSAARKIEAGWAESHAVAPLWMDPRRGTLLVAMVDPTRVGPLRTLGAKLGLEVVREVATASEVRSLIRHQFYRAPLDREPQRVNRATEDIVQDADDLVEEEQASPSSDGFHRAEEPGLEGLLIGPAQTATPPPRFPPRRAPTPAPRPSLDELGLDGLVMRGFEGLDAPAGLRATYDEPPEALTVRAQAMPALPELPDDPPRPAPPRLEPVRRNVDPDFPEAFSRLPDIPAAPPPRPTPAPVAPPPAFDMASDLSLDPPPPPPPPPARTPLPRAVSPALHIEIEDDDDGPMHLELEDDPPAPNPLPSPSPTPSPSPLPSPSPSPTAAPTPRPQPQLPAGLQGHPEQASLQRLWPVFEANQESARALKAVFEMCVERGIITRDEYMRKLQSLGG